MITTRTPFWQSPVALSAFVGFIVLFSALMAGYMLFDAGQDKLGDAAWTGSSAGAAIEGFLYGANAKSIEGPTNPYPEVSPLARDVNERLFNQHTRLFSWMTVAGELLLPIAVLALTMFRFRRSRALLVAMAMLAASLNFLYLTEGDSGANPPMVFMWLAIIWLAVLWPAAALFYAVDLSAPAGHPRTSDVASVESGAGLCLFFATVLLISAAGSIQMYWDRLGTLAALVAATFALTAALILIKRRIAQAPLREDMRPVTLELDQI
jgi:thiosulfate dehydrogenase [quinone] large subunit